MGMCIKELDVVVILGMEGKVSQCGYSQLFTGIKGLFYGKRDDLQQISVSAGLKPLS